jgi:hypothetical protein
MKPNIRRAVLGGFIGTLAITMLMYWGAPMMGLAKMDIAAMLGSMLGSWTMGMVMHFVNGTIIFPLIYVHFLFRLLPGTAAAKGLTWGVILWVVAQAMVMPMMGLGFFSLKMGSMMPAAASLMGHIIYGLLLGWIAGAASGKVAGIQARPHAA